MKRLTTYLLIVTAVLLSCTSCRKLGTFTLDYSTDIVIPSQTGISVPFTVYSPDVETNSTSKFESEGTSTKYVNKIQLSQLKLSIINPSSANFDFIDEIQIFISAPGQNETLIAEKLNIPETQLTSFLCDVKDVNLKDFISQDYYELRVRTVTDQVFSQEITIRADQLYTVEANIL